MTYLFPAGGQVGTTVEVTAAGSFDAWPVRAWVSGTGVTAAAGKEKGRLRFTIAADAAPGTYWVRLHDDTGASALRPFLVGTLPEVAEAEPNDEPGKPQRVERSAVVNGRLGKAGDVDCFAVRLTKGQTLVAAVEANRTLRSPMDGVLQVVTPDGFVVAQGNDHHGLDPQLAFTAPADGTYVARVFAFPATPDSGIRFAGGDAYVYRLTLTTGGFAEHADPLAVPKDSPGAVALVGWNIPDAARRVPVRPEPGGETAVIHHPLVANVVRARVEPHPCFTASPTAAARVPPFSLTGRLGAAGTPDTIPVVMKKGTPLAVQVESRAFGFATTPVLQVLDPAGKSVARAEPPALNRDGELAFTPPADGTYRVEVRDLHGDGGPRYGYLLRVVPQTPDFDLTVPSDRITVPPGKPTDVAVTVARRNGFAKPVALTVAGLPPGITAAGQGDGKTISLRFTADKAGFAGPILITGTADGEPGRVRTAKATTADSEMATTDLWLTVTTTPPPPPAKPAKK